ncbi:pectin lyase fold/virulence factor [Trichoderma barbatum]
MRFFQTIQWALPLSGFCSSHFVCAGHTIRESAFEIFPIPGNLARSTTFQIKVRSAKNPASLKWHQLELFDTPVHEINATTGRAQVHHTSVGLFDFNESVTLSIIPDFNIFPSIDTVRIRPLSYGIDAKIHGRRIDLTLSEPKDIVVEVNGDVFNALHLFLGSINDIKVPTSNAKPIRRYEAGYHELNETVRIPSGETVYLAPGAVVKGDFLFQNSSNAAILGRGVIYQSGSITVESSKNIRIEGVTILNPTHYSLTLGMADNVIVSKFRSISGVQWGDGIDVFCSTNVVLEKLFMRNSDDCIALYQHRWGYIGDSRNITVRDSALWADVAHPIHIGIHGNSVDPETMEGVTISNIDILDHREPQVDYMGCIAINCGDENLIKDVTIDNVRIEDFRIGMLFNFKVFFNPKYNTSPGRGIQDVTIKDVSYNGKGEVMSIITGYSETRSVDFVNFQGLTFNGIEIWDGMGKPTWYQTADVLPLFVGGHVNNLTWSKGG